MQQYDHVVMYLSLKVKITLHSRPSKLASEMKKTTKTIIQKFLNNNAWQINRKTPG